MTNRPRWRHPPQTLFPAPLRKLWGAGESFCRRPPALRPKCWIPRAFGCDRKVGALPVPWWISGLSLVADDAAPGFLLGGVVGFVGQHTGLGRAAAGAFLAADFLPKIALGLDQALTQRLELVE